MSQYKYGFGDRVRAYAGNLSVVGTVKSLNVDETVTILTDTGEHHHYHHKQLRRLRPARRDCWGVEYTDSDGVIRFYRAYPSRDAAEMAVMNAGFVPSEKPRIVKVRVLKETAA